MRISRDLGSLLEGKVKKSSVHLGGGGEDEKEVHHRNKERDRKKLEC